jgi:hypothetical protein
VPRDLREPKVSRERSVLLAHLVMMVSVMSQMLLVLIVRGHGGMMKVRVLGSWLLIVAPYTSKIVMIMLIGRPASRLEQAHRANKGPKESKVSKDP